ncbi:cellulose biosynthesis protein BcsQ [Shewanella sp. C32]|uniref:Cellulose biosynthesis protein BcsQ n=1 Tax=Shewanella electrica TaxID=515560 RepID=A0ABT2FPW8_9GAMM|nr:cellulose biosynthesis protein BcsQ [Shewanella electrica]MCH1926827.1 cellulose synthase operon protein YhjQ [Shewanella electrica]MCS4558388.1 cellulose biosynthesis protein BcsQ [Shewanella electrica]
MNLVYLTSPKGGVGRTTLTANLAYALQRLGHQVVVLDLDVQNTLRLHMGLAVGEHRGVVAQSQHNSDWREHIIETPSGVGLLPYGQATRAQREGFNALLRQEPDFLELRLGSLLHQPGCVTLVDLPSGPSSGLDAVKRMAGLGIVVMMADGSSAATLPLVAQENYLGADVAQRALYVINQVYIRSRLNRDCTEFFEQRLGAALLGRVHRDEAVPEATASKQSIFEYAPTSAVIQDLEDIARSISRALPDAYGHDSMKFSLR